MQLAGRQSVHEYSIELRTAVLLRMVRKAITGETKSFIFTQP